MVPSIVIEPARPWNGTQVPALLEAQIAATSTLPALLTVITPLSRSAHSALANWSWIACVESDSPVPLSLSTQTSTPGSLSACALAITLGVPAACAAGPWKPRVRLQTAAATIRVIRFNIGTRLLSLAVRRSGRCLLCSGGIIRGIGLNPGERAHRPAVKEATG